MTARTAPRFETAALLLGAATLALLAFPARFTGEHLRPASVVLGVQTNEGVLGTLVAALVVVVAGLSLWRRRRLAPSALAVLCAALAIAAAGLADLGVDAGGPGSRDGCPVDPASYYEADLAEHLVRGGDRCLRLSGLNTADVAWGIAALLAALAAATAVGRSGVLSGRGRTIASAGAGGAVALGLIVVLFVTALQHLE